MKKNLPIKWPPLPISLYLSTFWDTYESSNVSFYFSSLILPVFNPLPPSQHPQTPPQTPPHPLPKQHVVLQGVLGTKKLMLLHCSFNEIFGEGSPQGLNSQRDLEVVRNAWKNASKGWSFYQPTRKLLDGSENPG